MFAMFAPGPMEMVVLGMIALLLFGKRLPEVARSLGKGIVEFKKGVSGIEDDVTKGTYRAETRSTRPLPQEERAEVTAPKFEPPQTAPSEPERVE